MLSLFKSEEIEAVFYQGLSNFLLITFAPLNFTPEEQVPFWGARFARKAGISTIGFMPRHGDNWYPQRDMNAAAKSIQAITSQFDKIITYGSSMGGYGAIKYSALLGANACAAFGAQYSINPDDGVDAPAYTSLYRKEINEDMAVKASDICKTPYLFFDPYCEFDRNNALYISGQRLDTNLVKLPFMGHECVRTFAGTQLVTDLLKACLAGDTSLVRTIARTARSQSPSRDAALARSLMGKKPDLAFRIAERSLHKFSDNEQAMFFDRAASSALSAGDVESAEKYALRAAEIRPKHPNSLRRLASVYEQMGRYSEALHIYHNIIKHYPRDTPSHYAVSGLHLRDSRFSDAADALATALAIEPKSVRFLRRMSKIKLAQRLTDQATELLRQALSLSPQEAAIHYDFSGLFLTIGDLSGALASIEKAQALDPANASYVARRNFIQDKLRRAAKSAVQATRSRSCPEEGIQESA